MDDQLMAQYTQDEPPGGSYFIAECLFQHILITPSQTPTAGEHYFEVRMYFRTAAPGTHSIHLDTAQFYAYEM
jgi:hypothetical protein